MSTATQNQERLAGIIAEIVTTLGIGADGCNLGPGPDICALGDEAVAALKSQVGGTPSGRAEELIACLEAEIVKRDARIVELEVQRDAWKARSERRVVDIQLLVERHAAELAALKAHPSAGVANDRAAFEQAVWERDRPGREKPPLYRNHDKGVATSYLDPDVEAEWQACARLNPCRAQSVPAMARALADRCADACNVNRDDYWKQYGDDCIEDVRAILAAPSAQQKESER